jgi:two-component system, chemotaxis family, protein-glutamate methylesterase/glutaminase
MTQLDEIKEGEPQAATPIGQRDIVVIGASAGGVEALRALAERLPAELPAAVFVVLHVLPSGTSVLAQILDRESPLPCAAAVDGEPIERGRIYVAPPDHHLLLDRDHVRLTRGPRENGHRPAVDPLFRSAARTHGRRVIGVVLSGALDDGTAGLAMIRRFGGGTLVQDPADALYQGMPQSAIDHDPPARVVPISEMADAICTMIDDPLGPADEPMHNPGPPPAEPDRSDDDPRRGELTPFTCPECGGSLWEHDENGVVRFKCHVGHAYSPESLDAGQAQTVEMALWAALRNLQERVHFFRRLSRRSKGDRYEQKARDAEAHAEVLRGLVMSIGRRGSEAAEAAE